MDDRQASSSPSQPALGVTPWFWRRRHWWLLALTLALVGAYLALSLQRERDQIEAAELERLTRQSKVIEDNLTRQLIAINLSLDAIIAELPDWKTSANGRQEGIRYLKSLDASMPSVRTFLVLDAKGTITFSNQDELLDRNFYQRDYFQAPLKSRNAKMLHVSAPFKSVLNNYVVTLSRALLDSQGQFAGVVLATIDPLDIKVLLNSVRYAEDMRAMLVHGAGKVFVSEPDLAQVRGMDLSDPASFFSQHLKSKRSLSHFKGFVFSTGDQRLPLLRTLEFVGLVTDKPLVLILSREVDSLYAAWRQHAKGDLVAYWLLVVLSALGMGVYERLRARQNRTQERLKLATEASGVGIWEFDLASHRYHWDDAMFALSGLAPGARTARNDEWQQLLLPGELDRIKAATRASIDQRQPFDLTFEMQGKDGQRRFMRNRGALRFDARGKPRSLIGTSEDVTQRLQQEANLRIAAAAFDCQEGLVVTNPDKVILRVNQAFSTLFGYAPDEVIGQTPRVLKSGRHAQPFYAAMWERINRDGHWQGEIWNKKKSGEIFPDLLGISAVLDATGQVSHYVGTHLDITERKAGEEAIQKLAFHDPLTGLPNRRLLEDRLHQALSKAKRFQKRMALLYIDLDRFKPVNDEFGHAAGDELLLAVAQRLRLCVRESDTVARVGGDEFVVLLPVLEKAAQALAVAQKIHAALVQPFALSDGLVVTISSSIGIAMYPEHGSAEAELTEHADAAMYQAKAAGRDQFVMYALKHAS